jgi:phosphoglycolate phosphatase-like HAD superfamily hydrolase
LVGGEAHDWACFEEAIRIVLGFKPTREFFRSLPEITAQAIAEAAVRTANATPGTGLEERIRDEYLRGLRQVYSNDPHAFPPREGVVALLEHLGSIGSRGVAIATGDWRPTSLFKLGAAGIDVSRFPMATSSEASRRTDIIKLAAQQAGRPLSEVVYVGDGIWDLKACCDLGISFVGTGTRLDSLKHAGAKHMIEILEGARLLDVAQAAMRRTGMRLQ